MKFYYLTKKKLNQMRPHLGGNLIFYFIELKSCLRRVIFGIGSI